MRKSMLAIAMMMLIASFLLKTGEAEAKNIKINEDNFPNDYFMVYIGNKFDTNGDGKLSEKERNAVTEIDVGEASEYQLGLEYPGPDTVKGIEFFPNLEKLNCSGGSIKKLDVSHNTKLVELRCGKNNLTRLNLKKNKKLKSLYCFDNELKNLDLSQNTKLTDMSCSRNKIKEIDISNNKKLVTLECHSNKLKSLDLSKNKKLDYLHCDDNQISHLNLHNNKYVETFRCSNNCLITGNVKLTYTQLRRVEASTQKATIRCQKIGKHYYIPLSGVLKTNEITNLSYGKITEKGIRVKKKNLPKKITYEYNMFTDGDYMTKVTIKVKKK